MKYICFDISNLLYRTFFVQRDEDDETIAGLATHSALMTLNKYFKQIKPDRVVMAFDRNSWRKAYTASDVCLSKRAYKGNRRKDMSPAQQAKYARFLDHLREFEDLISKHTTIVTLAGDKLEADDLIAGFVQMHPDDQVTIISSDSDMCQLLKHDNVTIISPANDKPVNLEKEFDGDPELFLFFKCMRGDTSDNIRSAFPRVRAERLRKAYADPYERVQLMKEFWTDEAGHTNTVEDLYEENQLLIDLEQQPGPIRDLMTQVIETEMATKKQFSYFHLMKFIGKYQLTKIRDSIDQYLPLLSSSRGQTRVEL
jgi:hypothetical protein